MSPRTTPAPPSETSTAGRVSTRALVAAGMLVVLLLAGVVSFYASSHPDGLEYVAGEKGFEDTATEHGTAESPMADYATEGVENERFSGALAGVTGVVVVLMLAAGLALVVRRRAPEED